MAFLLTPNNAQAQRFGNRQVQHPSIYQQQIYPFFPYRPSYSVGFRPNIIWLPQGATLNVGPTRVYSYGGRRYVRFGINTGFYSIPQVNTFNFVTGR